MKTFKQFSEQAYSAKENIDEGLGTLVKSGLKKIVKPAIRWISRGKNARIPNEKTASLGRLVRDDISQLGKFKNPKTGNLEGTFLPNPTKPYQVKDFLQGKGGITWSFGQGRQTGPTPIQRQAIYRTYRGARDLARSVKNKLSGN